MSARWHLVPPQCCHPPAQPLLLPGVARPAALCRAVRPRTAPTDDLPASLATLRQLPLRRACHVQRSLFPCPSSNPSRPPPPPSPAVLAPSYVSIQDVPRTADHAPSRTFYTFRAAPEVGLARLAAELYQAAGNVHARLSVELAQQKEVRAAGQAGGWAGGPPVPSRRRAQPAAFSAQRLSQADYRRGSALSLPAQESHATICPHLVPLAPDTDPLGSPGSHPLDPCRPWRCWTW